MTSIEKHSFRITDSDQRPPLAPSDKNNDGITSRKPKTREISSRYMHSSSSSSSLLTPTVPTRHCPSPSIGQNSALQNLKRSQSVERRLPSNQSLPDRPTTSAQDSNLNNVIADSKSLATGRSLDGLCPSIHSSCDSFQADSCSLVNKREHHVSHPSLTPSTSRQYESSAIPSKAVPKRPEATLRTKNCDEPDNSKALGNSHAKVVGHHHRVSRSVLKGSAVNRSLDLCDKTSKAAASLAQVLGVQSDSINRDFQQSVTEGCLVVKQNNAMRRMSFDGRAESESHGTVMKENLHFAEEDCSSHVSDSFLRLSDSLSALEKFSIGSDLNIEGDVGSSRKGDGVPTAKGIIVSSRFLQMTNNRSHRHQRWRSCTPERETSSSTLRPSRTPLQAKGTSSNLLERITSNPSIGGSQSLPSSPIKFETTSSPSRGLISPSRIREQILSRTNSLRAHSISSSSIPNLVVEERKGNKRLNQVEDAHQLRLLYNRHLQWRFANARAHAASAVQTAKAKVLLYNVYAVILDLWHRVTLKNIKLQQLSRDMNLYLLLKGQVPYLDEWALLEEEHSSCLSGAIDALQSKTIRVPITDGIRVDIRSMKETLISASNVMRTMDLFMPSLLPKVERLNCFTSELAEIFAQERALVDECGDLLSTIAAMQAQESSYRAHLTQLKQASIEGRKTSMTVQEMV